MVEPKPDDPALTGASAADEPASSIRHIPGKVGVRDSTRSFSPLVELTLVRVREFVREPEAVFWVLVFPVLLAFALGIAFNNPVSDKLRVGVISESDNASRATLEVITNALARSPDIEPVALRSDEARHALRGGRIALVLNVNEESASDKEDTTANTPDGDKQSARTSQSPTAGAPAADLHSALPPANYHFDYRYDPTQPESRIARLAVDDALQRALGRGDVARVRDDRVTERGARYIDFLIPGLIGMNLMGSGMWGLGFAVVQARTRKLLKRLAATPMRRSDYLLSFMFSRLILLALEVSVVIVFARLVFGFTVNGSLLDLTVVSLSGALSFAGLGMLVAARPKTIEGVSGLMNLVMLPMWLLSGTFFSASRFPDFLQPCIQVLPLTALNDALRAVMNDGTSLVSHWTDVSILLAWSLISFALALRMFRWQ